MGSRALCRASAAGQARSATRPRQSQEVGLCGAVLCIGSVSGWPSVWDCRAWQVVDRTASAAGTTLVETEPGMPAAKASHFVCIEEAEGVFITCLLPCGSHSSRRQRLPQHKLTPHASTWADPMATAQPKFMCAWVSYDRLGNEVAHGGIGSSHSVIRGKMQHFLEHQMGSKSSASSGSRRMSDLSRRPSLFSGFHR